MEKGTKNLLLIGGGLLAGYLLFFRDKGSAGRPSAKAYLQLLPAGYSGRYGAMVPTPLVEGSSGNIARITITNTSKQGGVNVPYVFKAGWSLMLGSTLIAGQAGGYGPTAMVAVPSIAAGATVTYDFPVFAIPVGTYGTATATATIFTTDGVTGLASTPSLSVTISGSVVVPAGTIAW